MLLKIVFCALVGCALVQGSESVSSREYNDDVIARILERFKKPQGGFDVTTGVLGKHQPEDQQESQEDQEGLRSLTKGIIEICHGNEIVQKNKIKFYSGMT
ncbi:uncharacterized protein [Venturia canescens]|uniref:uncharacterized protein n=1 Tax=Venturia canescens TaxID=32260 RepID=UPI001C9D3FD9|nr:uncharacterized protein LOC122405942 [Venturia canescens]XP_043266963.1 uncharacterized protein LOC122405942 [Venturia canescens]